jgi:arylsulfatase A-like enzyme
MRHTTALALSLAAFLVSSLPARAGEPAAPRDDAPRRGTTVSIVKGKWHLDGKVTYPGAPAEGLLLNVRMVNATFEDRNRPDFDPEANLAAFLEEVPDYAAHGVRAFTLCLQGGFPGYEGALNSAFEPDGTLRPGYLERVERAIDACDRQGLAVILGCFYQRQSKVLRDEGAVRAGLRNAVEWLRRTGHRNVLLEVANEYPHGGFVHPILRRPEGMAELIRLAKAAWPELLVSASGIGDGELHDPVAEAADFLLPHYNGTPVAKIPERISSLRRFGKPIVCNEDDKVGADAAAALEASVREGASWGLMLKDLNQYRPFEFHGAADDPVVYARMKELASPRGSGPAGTATSSTSPAPGAGGGAKGKAPPPNVLFIAVDDLRPQLGCYGDPTVKSPHIDRLAARGLVFERAYCQQALCSPSRISLLSGRHPETTRIFTIGPALRETMPEVITLPQHFKLHGYFARSLGKVFHVGIDDPASWSIPSWHSKAPRYGPEGTAAVARRRAELQASGKPLPGKGEGSPFYAGPAFEAPDVADDALLDGDTAREAVLALRELARSPDRPFFLAVGFHNPHVPWVAPKRYWDLYREEDIPLPSNPYPPRNAPPFAARSGDDFYWYGNVPKDRKITPELGRRCIHGYLAAISYVDAQVGRLLVALQETGLAERTVVALWGDHGYYMGEHGWWGGKHNNYEGATRAPLIVAVPGQKTAGRRTAGLVSFVDIYPSLVEICALPMPEGLEGRSFKPLLDDPTSPGKTAAFSWYPRGRYLGTAMRTDRYRYVEWKDKKGDVAARELYDHERDPAENENVAGREDARPIIEELGRRLRGGWSD